MQVSLQATTIYKIYMQVSAEKTIVLTLKINKKMRKINEFNITKLRNDVDFGFHDRVCPLAKNYITLESDAAMLASYVTPFTSYDTAVKQNATNSYTASVTELDAIADTRWRNARAYIRAVRNCPDVDIADAGARIYAVFEKYGDFTNMGYTQEYGMYHNLLQDLAEISKEDMDLTGFAVWYLSMEEAYDNFIAARAGQTTEESKRIAGLIKDCRAATDTAYRNFCAYINVMVMVNGEETYADFIDSLNVIVAEMSAMLAARATRAANAKKEEDASTEENA